VGWRLLLYWPADQTSSIPALHNLKPVPCRLLLLLLLQGAPHPPISGAGAVGWRLLLYWPADQAWHEAEVLTHDEIKRQHHLLYLDGEEEWADLSRENVVWLRATRHGALSAGIVTGGLRYTIDACCLLWLVGASCLCV
jgi:hypothetical protein